MLPKACYVYWIDSWGWLLGSRKLFSRSLVCESILFAICSPNEWVKGEPGPGGHFEGQRKGGVQLWREPLKPWVTASWITGYVTIFQLISSEPAHFPRAMLRHCTKDGPKDFEYVCTEFIGAAPQLHWPGQWVPAAPSATGLPPQESSVLCCMGVPMGRDEIGGFLWWKENWMDLGCCSRLQQAKYKNQC